MPNLYNLQYLNANSQRSYPLTEDATKLDETGSFELPDDFILALHFPIHAGLNVQPIRFFISKIAVFGAGFRIVVGYDNGSTPVVVATATIPRATHKEYASYTLSGTGDYIDIKGKIVIGSIRSLGALPPGSYTFALAGTQIEPEAIWPMIQYVSGLTFINNGQRSSRLQGDIEFVAGERVRFTIADADTTNPKVRWDAIDGENLNQNCECNDTLGPPIRTINGEPPTPTGDFTFVAGDCLQITPFTAGLQFANTCARPCCDCPELAALVDELKFLGSEARVVTGTLLRLQATIDTAINNILISQLSSDSCLACS